MPHRFSPPARFLQLPKTHRENPSITVALRRLLARTRVITLVLLTVDPIVVGHVAPVNY